MGSGKQISNNCVILLIITVLYSIILSPWRVFVRSITIKNCFKNPIEMKNSIFGVFSRGNECVASKRSEEIRQTLPRYNINKVRTTLPYTTLVAAYRFTAEVLAHSRFSGSGSSASGRTAATASATSVSCFWTDAIRAQSSCWSSVARPMIFSTAPLNASIARRPSAVVVIDRVRSACGKGHVLDRCPRRPFATFEFSF